MKKNRIVGDEEEQGELICELPGCGEYGFAETENTEKRKVQINAALL